MKPVLSKRMVRDVTWIWKRYRAAATITLDFNKAYNPYCAYISNFSCPLPPSENLLTIPIKAGEKTYQ